MVNLQICERLREQSVFTDANYIAYIDYYFHSPYTGKFQDIIMKEHVFHYKQESMKWFINHLSTLNMKLSSEIYLKKLARALYRPPNSKTDCAENVFYHQLQ